MPPEILVCLGIRYLSDLQQLLSVSERPINAPSKHKHDGKGKTVRVFLDTKGRKGKSITKDGNVEIQGDQRAWATQKLREMKYVVR